MAHDGFEREAPWEPAHLVPMMVRVSPRLMARIARAKQEGGYASTADCVRSILDEWFATIDTMDRATDELRRRIRAGDFDEAIASRLDSIGR